MFRNQLMLSHVNFYLRLSFCLTFCLITALSTLSIIEICKNQVITFKLNQNIQKSSISPYGNRAPIVRTLKTRHKDIFLWGMIMIYVLGANFLVLR